MRNCLTRLELHLCVTLVCRYTIELFAGFSVRCLQSQVHVGYCISSRMEAQSTQVHPYPLVVFTEDDVDASCIASLSYSTKDI